MQDDEEDGIILAYGAFLSSLIDIVKKTLFKWMNWVSIG